MSCVNLIPARRIDCRRRAARVRLWLSGVPVFASLLVAVYGSLRTTWDTDTESLRESISAADLAITSLDAGIASHRASIHREQVLLKAYKAVGEQPDWGVLLYLLASRLGEDAVLNNLVLEPLPGARAGGKAVEGARPGRFRLTLFGMARDQEAVSAFVLALEGDAGAQLFDQVRLLESKRVSLSGKDAVSFRIECMLSDAAAGDH